MNECCNNKKNNNTNNDYQYFITLVFFLDAKECIFNNCLKQNICSKTLQRLFYRGPVPSSKFCRVNSADTTWTEINWKGKLSHFPFHQSTTTTIKPPTRSEQIMQYNAIHSIFFVTEHFRWLGWWVGAAAEQSVTLS